MTQKISIVKRGAKLWAQQNSARSGGRTYWSFHFWGRWLSVSSTICFCSKKRQLLLQLIWRCYTWRLFSKNHYAFSNTYIQPRYTHSKSRAHWNLKKFEIRKILKLKKIWNLENFEIWKILKFEKFLNSKNFEIWKILKFEKFWNLNNFEIWIILKFGKF